MNGDLRRMAISPVSPRQFGPDKPKRALMGPERALINPDKVRLSRWIFGHFSLEDVGSRSLLSRWCKKESIRRSLAKRLSAGKEKHININNLGDCPRTGWVANICLCDFWGHSSCGKKK